MLLLLNGERKMFRHKRQKRSRKGLRHLKHKHFKGLADLLQHKIYSGHEVKFTGGRNIRSERWNNQKRGQFICLQMFRLMKGSTE